MSKELASRKPRFRGFRGFHSVRIATPGTKVKAAIVATQAKGNTLKYPRLFHGTQLPFAREARSVNEGVDYKLLIGPCVDETANLG
jgi:hypothetical protein